MNVGISVHPHIRGAYVCESATIAIGFRFIPTYVGHTDSASVPNRSPSVHPHIRGAYGERNHKDGHRDGSSPHTWGILPWEAPGESGFRFIPTYVGHTDNKKFNTLIDERFIPTYVGHTQYQGDRYHPGPVHPHIRGAYSPMALTRPLMSGSSPHTWGIRLVWGMNRALYWFIPTYVGHTIIHRGPIIGPPVHPHIRGAYVAEAAVTEAATGSSPHTWGIHWTTVRKMAGFSHFSYDFTQKSYFVQGLVFFGVIGAEAFPTHRRGRSQCLSGAHGGSVRNL